MMPSTSRNLLAACALGFSISSVGCGATLVPFTQELRSEHRLAAEDIEQLQFYLSHTVKLRREVELRARSIERGHLELHSGKTIEEVVIEEETPGVAVAVSNDVIGVSFQEGTALSFSIQPSESYPAPQPPPPLGRFAEPPDPFPGDRLSPHPDVEPVGLGGSYFLQTDADGSRIAFHGKWWQPVDESSLAHLMIDAEQLEDVVESHTVLEGRTVGKRARRSHPVPLLMF